MSVRDGAPFLEEAVRSVLTQSFRDFELVVVDNGSSDATPAILARLAAEDERLVVVRQDPGLSLGAALNLGLARVRCELVARMDADDVCLPDRLGRQVSYMERHPQTAVLGSAYRVFGAGEERTVHAPRHPLEVAWRYTWENCLGHPTVMLRRSVVLEAGGYPDGSAQDFVLFSRLACRHRLANLPEVLLRYRVHGHNMSILERPELLAEAREVWLGNLKELGVPAELREAWLEWHWRRPVPRRYWWPLVRANVRVLRTLARRLGYGLEPWLWMRLLTQLAQRVRQHAFSSSSLARS